jgi:putative peptidoglycan lipid II flippase
MFQIGHRGSDALDVAWRACFNATLLYVAMRRSGVYTPSPGWGRFLARVAMALLVLGVVLWFAGGDDTFLLTAGLWAKVGRLAGVVATGAIAYFAALWLLGFRLADFNRREPM